MLITLLVAIKTPRVFDGLMWRIERFQGRDSYPQRTLENFLYRLNSWQDQSSPKGSFYLIGDSHLQLIPQHLSAWSLNFAINGQPMSRLITRVGQLPGLKSAGAVIVNGGENDLAYGISVDEIEGYWKQLFKQNPDIKRFVCVGLPMTERQRRDLEKVKLLNTKIEQVCRENGAPFVQVQMGQGVFFGYSLAIDNVHLARETMAPFAALLERTARAQATRS